MFNLFIKGYESFKQKIVDFKKMYDFKNQESFFENERFYKKNIDYYNVKFNLEKEKKLNFINYKFFKKEIFNRFIDNFFRIISGRELLQEEESNLGLVYVYNNSPKFMISDKNKYLTAKKDLEFKVLNSDYYKRKVLKNNFTSIVVDYFNNNTNTKNNNENENKNDKKIEREEKKYNKYDTKNNNQKRYNNYKQNKQTRNLNKYKRNNTEKNIEKNYQKNIKENYFALYIDSFRKDCFTNELANFQASSKIKNIANNLASYVSNGSETLAPCKRSWNVRIKNLETLLKNDFTVNDVYSLKELKNILSKNKYLVNKKNEEYKKAISLINKITEVNKNV